MKVDEDDVYDKIESEYWEEEQKKKRFISKEESQPTTHPHFRQNFKCPNCGSYNTYQTTYVDGCNTCGDSQGY